jgi:lipoprotein NlpI
MPILNALKRHTMHPAVKFFTALLVTLGFFVVWDRAQIASFRSDAYVDSGLKAKDDLQRALPDFSEAIRLNPLNSLAYISRGKAYQEQGELDRAVADYNEAIRLRPNSATAHYNRGNAFSMQGDFARAILDYSQVIRIHPKQASGFANRGRAYFYQGSLAQARTDFEQALKLEPNEAYSALWLDLAERRDHLSSQLPKIAQQLNPAAWPAPIVKFFLGGRTADAVVAEAVDPSPQISQAQACEANFYLAEVALLKQQPDEAVRLFQLAADGCPRSFVEWRGANAELARLGVHH